MAIKHLKPRSLNNRQIEEYKNSFLTAEEAEFIEDMSQNLPSAMEIYLPVKECKELYDLVVNKKYKIKSRQFNLEDYDYDIQKAYKKRIESWLEKGWVEFWDEDNMDEHDVILIKAPEIKEDAMGGVSAPMATLYNVPGMGNAVPPSSTTNGIGSGDKWGNTIGGKPYTQSGQPKKKKKVMKKRAKKVKEDLKENNVNPYDKLGQSMLKRAKVKSVFKKKKDPKNQNAMVQSKFEHEIMPFDEFKKINE